MRRYERVRERVSDRVSEMKNIDHHHHHHHQQHLYHHHQPELLTCHGTAMIIRLTMSLPMFGYVKNVRYSVTCTVRTLVHVRNVPPESSMRARRSAISLMRPQICEVGLSFPDKDQGLRVPKGYECEAANLKFNNL